MDPPAVRFRGIPVTQLNICLAHIADRIIELYICQLVKESVARVVGVL